MAVTQYKSVYNENQGIFNNPRQKMWGVFHNWDGSYWRPEIFTNNFDEAKEKFREILHGNREKSGIDNIILCEIVPTDTILIPPARF
ncbi:hypothetical protein ACXAT3_002674 [Clostridium sporogenes]|nr:hypothetical protein [Clostridium botulinum]